MQISPSTVTSSAALGASLTPLVADNAAIRARLNTLTEQASTGLVAQTYAGLGGAAAGVSLSLAPAIAEQQTVQTAISDTSAQMDAAQTALQQISSIAANFQAQTVGLNTISGTAVDGIAASARDALTQVAGLLDTQVGGVYVFAGQDSANPPIPDPDDIGTSGFATQIASAVAGLATNGAAATAAATLSVASSNATGTSPFSTALSQPAAALQSFTPQLALGDGTSVPVGIVASANSDVASGGSSTTGSYTRDILRALATIGSLSDSQTSAAGFMGLVQDTNQSLANAVTALNQDAGVLGDRQTALTARSTEIGQVTTALQGQLSGAQDVDMTATLSELTQTQTQLQASYQIIAQAKGMSLAQYLPT